MPASIAALLRRVDLGMTLLCGDATERLAAPIRWVTTSELADPTPFLRGGELLLTTGMRLPTSKSDVLDYVARLDAAGVVGIGMGIGQHLAFRTVPPRLVHAASGAGFPLLLVDEPTPFIAIGEAVAHMHFADETAALAQALKAQQTITRAAVTAGPGGVVRQLAALTEGWALMSDVSGQVVHEAPDGTSKKHTRWRAELGRLRGGRSTSAAVSAPGEYVTVQILGDGRNLRGFLVTGRDSPPGTAHHSMTNVAAALLSVALGRGVVEPEFDTDYPDSTFDTDSAAALVDPLVRYRPYSRVPLAHSVQVWLKHHGRFEPAAAELGLHRNTLHYRIRKAADLIERDMDDPSVRAQLWAALAAPSQAKPSQAKPSQAEPT
ncbi:MAG: PucR family transcriptional regulator [Nakamurella sp.]